MEILLILIWQRIFRAGGKKICVLLNPLSLSNVIVISMSSSMEAEFILAVAPLAWIHADRDCLG